MADILIIDDDPQMRRLLTLVLEGAGHTVCEAENGRDGIELFQHRRPALVISDILMPDMEGIETISAIRRDAPKLPIIAISGGSNPMYLAMSTSLGATASLDKPFTPDQLLRQVNSLLSG